MTSYFLVFQCGDVGDDGGGGVGGGGDFCDGSGGGVGGDGGDGNGGGGSWEGGRVVLGRNHDEPLNWLFLTLSLCGVYFVATWDKLVFVASMAKVTVCKCVTGLLNSWLCLAET